MQDPFRNQVIRLDLSKLELSFNHYELLLVLNWTKPVWNNRTPSEALHIFLTLLKSIFIFSYCGRVLTESSLLLNVSEDQ